MSEPFLGEIRMFASNFAPRGWAFCDGQLLAVSQNDALFSLLGTIYGGDGRTTFGLPDLRGRIPVHFGSGPGIPPLNIGARGGAEQVSLTVNQLPSHTHALQPAAAAGNEANPAGNRLASSGSLDLFLEAPPIQNLAADSVGAVGGSQAHENMPPFQCIHYIIALVGIFPSRA